MNAPLYLSAGLDCEMAREHPEWIELNEEGRPVRHLPLRAGFDKMCFHSPYLAFLCAQIEEVATLFPDCDGIFLDIIGQGPGCSPSAMEYMARNGLDASKGGRPQESGRCGRREILRSKRRPQRADCGATCRSFTTRATSFADAMISSRSKAISSWSRFRPVAGAIDHFPESASYVAQLGKAYLGMTGKFHTTWGEMGGYKHPNALRYECGAMLAFGASCSIGDQALPSGELDPGSYELIGSAYREVKTKEPWCVDAVLAPRNWHSFERGGKRAQCAG